MLKTTFYRAKHLSGKDRGGVLFPPGWVTDDVEKRLLAADWVFMFETIQALSADPDAETVAELIADVLGSEETRMCYCGGCGERAGPHACRSCGGSHDQPETREAP